MRVGGGIYCKSSTEIEFCVKYMQQIILLLIFEIGPPYIHVHVRIIKLSVSAPIDLAPCTLAMQQVQLLS